MAKIQEYKNTKRYDREGREKIECNCCPTFFRWQKYKNTKILKDTIGKGESRLNVIVVPPSMATEQALHRVPPPWVPCNLFLHFPQSHPTNTDPSSSISSFSSSLASPPLTAIVKPCPRLPSFLHVPQTRGGREGGQGRC